MLNSIQKPTKVNQGATLFAKILVNIGAIALYLLLYSFLIQWS